jgi:hypothetical protein
VRAWSFYTNVQENTYAGHDGYEDVLGSVYSYDDSVPNHLQVTEGDLIVLRDGSGSLGVGFVESIVARAGKKFRRRCPACGTAEIEARKTKTPLYRCTNGHTFEESECVNAEDDAQIYCASYRASFLAIDAIGTDELESLSLARAWQNAIRELELGGILSLLRKHRVLPAFVLETAGGRVLASE